MTERDATGFTALHIAANDGNVSYVDELIKANADVNRQANDGSSALHIASLKGHVKVVDELIKANANVNLQDKNKNSPLHSSSRNGHVKVADKLVKAGANVNLQTDDGWSPLHFASQNGHVKVADKLVKAGADVNLRNQKGSSPLHLSSQNGHIEVVKILIQTMTDVNLLEENGFSPLHFATLNEYVEVMAALIKANANVNIQRQYCWSPLHVASRFGRAEVVDTLIKANADVNLQQQRGCSPLHYALPNGRVEVVDALIKANIDANLRGQKGWASLHYAAPNEHMEVVDSLIKANANVNLQDSGGNTPLHVAIKFSNFYMVQSLLTNGADVSIKCHSQSTPLDIACFLANIPAMKLILCHISQHQLDVRHCISECCVSLATDCIAQLPDNPFDAVTPVLTCRSDTDFSSELHSAMLQAGFHSTRSALQSAAADVMQDIERRRRIYDEMFIVGSFADGWGNSLTSLNGKIDSDSDIDVTSFVSGRLYHIRDRCSCDTVTSADKVQYENGHVMCSGEPPNPSRAIRRLGLKPAFDLVSAYRSCCYPYMEVVHKENRTTQLPQLVFNSLRLQAAQQGCHLVTAAAPGLQGRQLRVSTTFLEKILMRSLTTVQGQLFILLKYLIKKVIGHQVKGLKTYHAKCLLFYLLDRTPLEQWQPCKLLSLAREALHMLLHNLQDTESQSNECMRHFFMRDAAVYLKKNHDEKQIIAQAVNNTMENLHELLTQFKDSLRVVRDDAASFYFHPFLCLPNIFYSFDFPDSGRLEYRDIYNAVRHLVLQLSQQQCSEQSVNSVIDRIPDSACTTRETLRAMACLKFNKQQDAVKVLRHYTAQAKAVSRGLHCPRDMTTDAASVDKVWQHLHHSDSAWKFCFDIRNRKKLSCLPQFLMDNFPTEMNNYIYYFFMNFDVLMKCLCLELLGDDVMAQSWFKDVLHSEDADIQELLMTLHYCNDSELLLELIHKHRTDIADDLITVNAVESLMQQQSNLRDASSRKSLIVVTQKLTRIKIISGR